MLWLTTTVLTTRDRTRCSRCSFQSQTVLMSRAFVSSRTSQARAHFFARRLALFIETILKHNTPSPSMFWLTHTRIPLRWPTLSYATSKHWCGRYRCLGNRLHIEGSRLCHVVSRTTGRPSWCCSRSVDISSLCRRIFEVSRTDIIHAHIPMLILHYHDVG